jgi:copper chaperone
MQAFKVGGMTCGHCVRAVTEAVHGIDPDSKVDVDLAAGSVTTNSAMQPDRLADAIREAGYTVAAASAARA